MAQQKQRKQLILTDNKNISTYLFQSTQRLQPDFMTDGIRNFMYTKHNGDNAKLIIFSFIPQLQRIQPNFMNDSIKTFHTYQTTKHKNTHNPNNQILQYSYSNSARNWPISYISSITNFVHFIDPQNLYLAC